MMTEGILQRLEARQPFRPATVDEFFALQLARKLNDTARVKQYCFILSRTPFPQILTVYGQIHRSSSEVPASDRLLRQFHPS